LEPIRIAVLTISDRCAAGEAEDLSGPTLVELFREAGHKVGIVAVVPDERKQIASALKRWSDEGLIDVIVTTGGTGLAPRDVTCEVTRKIVDRDLPSVSAYLMIEGLKKTPFAALSQPFAGIRLHTLIVNLPGSPGGAKDGGLALLPILSHLLEVMQGVQDSHPTLEQV